MEYVFTQPLTNNRGWRHLAYALLALTTALILSTSSCDDDEAEKVGGKIPRGQRFSSVQQ